MKQLFFAIFLIVATQTLKNHILSTTGMKQLTPNDMLVSTMGIFRVKLLSSGCKLAVDTFNSTTSAYVSKGNYSSNIFTGNCNYLNVTEGKLVTNNGSDYLTVTSISFNHSTLFNIDDNGVMRLIGSYIETGRNVVSKETKL